MTTPIFTVEKISNVEIEVVHEEGHHFTFPLVIDKNGRRVLSEGGNVSNGVMADSRSITRITSPLRHGTLRRQKRAKPEKSTEAKPAFRRSAANNAAWPPYHFQRRRSVRSQFGFLLPSQSGPSRQAGRVALRDPKQAQVVTSIIEFHTGSLPKLVESVPDTPAYSLARCPDVLQPCKFARNSDPLRGGFRVQS